MFYEIRENLLMGFLSFNVIVKQRPNKTLCIFFLLFLIDVEF